MNFLMLVNKDNALSKTYVPDNLVNADSKYRDNVLVADIVYKNFKKMATDMNNLGYDIDIMSGYREYIYQEKLYNKSLNDKGFAYTFRSVAKPGCSEHQTGLAIDICVYKNEKCYVEHEIEDMEEDTWLRNNAYKYGFILRYPKGKEDITGYNYEPWHYRYVGKIAEEIYFNNITLEEYLEKYCK